MKQYKPFIFGLLTGILFFVCYPSCIQQKPEEQTVGYLNVNPQDLPDLYYLGYTGQIDLIKRLMKEQPEEMADPDNQRECLIGAICGERKELVRYLLCRIKNVDLNKHSEADWGYLRYPNSPFYFALKTGNKDIIALLVKYGAQVNSGDPNYIPLSLAVESGDLASVRFLLQKGADVNVDFVSPLYRAFERKDMEMIRLLLTYGADVNYGRTCLGLCVKMKEPELVSFLLDKGADVNKRGEYEWTPLQLAVDYRQTEMMTLFIERGADVNAQVKHSKYGTLTPLWLAVSNGDMTSVDFLLEHGAVIQETSSLLLAAALSGNREVFDYFLDKVPTPTNWESIWETALENNNEYVIRYMIERHLIDINKRPGESNFLPLEIALRNWYWNSEKNKRIVCYLLEKGADPALVGTNDEYVHDTMDWMMKNSSLEFFDYFLELGFPFEEWTDPDHLFTRFIYALDYEYFDAARHLLKQAGGKPSVYINHYRPPILHYANQTYEDPFPVLEFLVKEKVDTAFYPHAFLRCVWYNDLESVTLFLQNGVDVNVKNSKGQNALWYVRDPEMAEYLIKRGIDVSIPLIHEEELIDMSVLSVFVKWGIPIRLAQDELEKALRMAARTGNDVMVTYFIERGADVNALGEKTPLMENASRGYERCSGNAYRKVSPKVIKQLLKAGADVDAKDKEGNTALMYALGEYTCKDHKCRSRYEWDRHLYHGGLNFPDQDRSLIVRELLKAGADVNKENYKGDTPFTLAVRYEHKDLIPLLKKYGAVK